MTLQGIQIHVISAVNMPLLKYMANDLQTDWHRHRQKLDAQWDKVESLAAAKGRGGLRASPPASNVGMIPSNSQYVQTLPGLNMDWRL